MKRNLMRFFRMSLVASLVISLGTSPASACWLLKRWSCRSAPHLRTPTVACAPVECCPTVETTSTIIVSETVICPPDATVVDVSEVILEGEVSPVVPPADTIESHATPPSAAEATQQSVAPAEVIPAETPAPAIEPVTPAEPVVPAEPEVPVTPPTGYDLFDQPAVPAPAEPAPNANALDDLFGEQPAPAPATEPLPAAEPMPAVDDFFGTPPAAPAEEAPKGLLDDLFGDQPAAEPATPAADDLFGNPPVVPAEEAPKAEPAEDLFGTPPATEPAPTNDLDDLFGDQPAVAPVRVPVAADLSVEPSFAPAAELPATDAVDDLFGNPPAATAGPDAGGAEAPATEDVQPAEKLDDLFSEPRDQETDPVDDLFGGVSAGADESQISIEVKSLVDPLAAASQRVWVDNTGNFSTEGRLIEIGVDYIRLMKENGRTCTVPIQRLSPADTAHVESVRQERQEFHSAMLSAR